MFWRWIFRGCLLAMASATYPTPQAQTKVYSKTKPEFMPSEPGEPPACLKDPRLTYCTDPDDYPKERILYLLKNNMFDISTILMDETRDTYTFEAMDAPMPMYDYSPPQQGYLPPIQAPSPSYNNATQYHHQQQPKSGYYGRPAPSKYGSTGRATPFVSQDSGFPSGRQFVLPAALNSSYATSSYSSYLPPSGGANVATGRGGVVASSTPYLYNRPTPNSDEFTPYPRYPKPSSSSSSASRYTGPRAPPDKAQTWWRKVSRPGGMRYRRQAPAAGDAGVAIDDLCPSRASYITPRAAQSIQGDWMYLVNLDDDPRYTQLVRSETCIRNQCSGACQAPPDSVAVCQQQFVQKRLVALAGTGQTLNQDIFWFPSCCVCKIRRR